MSIDDIPELSDHDWEHYAAHYWPHHRHPAFRRVWDDGRDVTDQDPETWPDLWNPSKPRPWADNRSRGRR